MLRVLAILISVCLILASLFLVPGWLMLACLGFTGHLADAGWEMNLQGGVVFSAMAALLLSATFAWFVWVFPKFDQK